MDIDGDVTQIKGIGPEVAIRYAQLGIKSPRDLLFYFPKQYDDYSDVVPIARLEPGQRCVKARIHGISGRYVRRGMHITEATASDATASVRLVWFNQPYRAAAIHPNSEYYIAGKYELSRGRFIFGSPTIELAEATTTNTARIVPKYRETRSLTSRSIRKHVKTALDMPIDIDDVLHPELLDAEQLPGIKQTIQELHFPNTLESFAAAKRRMGFEELLVLQIAAQLSRQQIKLSPALMVPSDIVAAQQFVANLPFKLTAMQRKTAWEIIQDMTKQHAMNRLVEGDVGSGKTLIAAMAMLMSLRAGLQSILLAPTALLTAQHAASLKKVYEGVGYADSVVVLQGATKAAERTVISNRLASGEPLVLVSTHAVLHADHNLSKIALVVVDEQHRFGVEQRRALLKKTGHMPHMLSMTATPIPRTLALLAYGELDISIMNEMPPGRQPIATRLFTLAQRPSAYQVVEEQLGLGHQAFVVCPMITEGETDRVSAEAIHKELAKKLFKHRRVGILHGKMKAAEKAQVMDDFVAHKLDILVATTVIEVGVDVPNATIMVVEGSEHFGLAQLHQLRGRVGRNQLPGFCFAISQSNDQPSKRLRAFASSQNGFELAEYDLRLRGPGAIFGTRQHGDLDLRFVDLNDHDLIARAKKHAKRLAATPGVMVKYPHLFKAVKLSQKITTLN